MHVCTQPTDTLPASTVCQVLLDTGMGYQGARQTMSLSQDAHMLVERPFRQSKEAIWRDVERTVASSVLRVPWAPFSILLPPRLVAGPQAFPPWSVVGRSPSPWGAGRLGQHCTSPAELFC